MIALGDTPANLSSEPSDHLMPRTSCLYGKWVEDVCVGQFGVFVVVIMIIIYYYNHEQRLTRRVSVMEMTNRRRWGHVDV